MAATDDILAQTQKAIVAVLTADATLKAKVSGIYDQPPVDATYPYVTVGDSIPTPWNSFDRRGRMVLATLHVWSRYKGYTEADSIVADLNRLLDRGALTLTGLTLVYCQFEDANPMRDPDGITRHIVVRYRILTQTT